MPSVLRLGLLTLLVTGCQVPETRETFRSAALDTGRIVGTVEMDEMDGLPPSPPGVGALTAPQQPDYAPGLTQAPSDWRFAAALIAWTPDIPAKVETDQATVRIPEDFDDVLDNLDGVAEFHLEAQKGRWGAFLTYIYIGLDVDEGWVVVDGPFEDRDVGGRESVSLLDVAATFEIARWRMGEGADAPISTLGCYGGFRYLTDPIRIEIDPGPTIRERVEFFTPLVGIDGVYGISKHWDAHLQFDYGGFDVDDVDETYTIYGAARYHFNWGKAATTVFLGYRHLGLKYDGRKAYIDVEAKGPIAGLPRCQGSCRPSPSTRRALHLGEPREASLQAG